MRAQPMELVLIAAAVAASSCGAATLPTPARDDARISYVRYSKDDVTVIEVQRGTATRIVLGADEKIAKDGSATGFPSDCSKAEMEWCIHAAAGSNQVLVKPKDGATHNNLELKTDIRDYSFAFRVLPDTGTPRTGKRDVLPAAHAPMYRVVFTYPPTVPIPAVTAALARVVAATERLPGAMLTGQVTRPIAKNWQYTMQPAKGSNDIVPSLVFDDGRFTYFRFPANREIPTIFAISPQGEESRVNFHVDAADSSLLAVQRMGRRFVLRLGTSAVGIWNDAFDANGLPPVEGTTVSGVARVLREGNSK